jgi:hypothetical protein
MDLSGKPCATNLWEFLEKATAAAEQGETFDIIYLDFANAFDKLPQLETVKEAAGAWNL